MGLKICKKCGVPIPGKPEDICYHCYMDEEPEESQRLYADAVADRVAWLTVLQKAVTEELANKSLRGSGSNAEYALRSAYCELKEKENGDSRIANCPGHEFSYAFSTSHEHIYECSCGATDSR